MSDPVTNAEVEDVLSSIRRLVSEDKRPAPTQREVARPDRLVLTPSLRVADDPIPEPVDDRSSFSSSIDVIAKAVSESAMPADEAAEGRQLDNDLVARFSVGQDDGVGLASTETAEEPAVIDPALDYSNDPYHFDEAADSDGEGLEARSSEADQELEEDLVSLKENLPQVEPAPVVEAVFDEPDDEDELVIPSSEAATGLEPTTLSAKIEALEAAIGNIPDTWEPDSAGESDFAGTEAETMAWEDNEPDDGPAPRLHFAPVAEPAVSSEQEAEPTAEPGDTPHEEAVGFREDELIDEDALRDLVSEIVRSELQGDLGQRITRNVRKLVRREIHRALAAQELE